MGGVGADAQLPDQQCPPSPASLASPSPCVSRGAKPTTATIARIHSLHLFIHRRTAWEAPFPF